MAELNALPPADFAAALEGVFEHSPWIARAAADRRPFADAAQLLEAVASIVAAADAEKQLALINAHPDLAARIALTPESAREQAAAGLSGIDDATRHRIQALNAAYRARFGFPFLICARLNNVATIIQAMETRVHHDREDEIATALGEISSIARLRLADLVTD